VEGSAPRPISARHRLSSTPLRIPLGARLHRHTDSRAGALGDASFESPISDGARARAGNIYICIYIYIYI